MGAEASAFKFEIPVSLNQNPISSIGPVQTTTGNFFTGRSEPSPFQGAQDLVEEPIVQAGGVGFILAIGASLIVMALMRK